MEKKPINYNRKSKGSTIRFRYKEKEKMLEEADKLELSFSEYVKLKISNGNIRVRYIDSSYEKLHFELNKIGVNLNQIAKTLNENQKTTPSQAHVNTTIIDDHLNQLRNLVSQLEVLIAKKQ